MQFGAAKNRATTAVAATLGVLVGLGSIDHGILEILQGNRPTPGAAIYALGAGNTWTRWSAGGEGAITLIPNFLATGVVATLLGVALIAWSVRWLSTRRGPTVFLLLSGLSFVSGGGVAQLALFTLNWAAATRIRSSLGFWRGAIPPMVRPLLARWWRACTALATLLFVTALELAVWGWVPMAMSDTRVLHLNWAFAGGGLSLYAIAFVCALASDCSEGASAGANA